MNHTCEDCKNEGQLFGCLNDTEKRQLTAAKGNNFYKKGQVIFYEGNHPQSLFCVYEGKVKLSKLCENGKETVMRFATNGDIIGYRALLSGGVYKATATALEDSVICQIPKPAFMEMLTNSSDLSLATMKLLSEDLLDSEKRLNMVSQIPGLERIAITLLLLKKKFGTEEDGKTLAVNLRRREIGDIAGLATETTIRTLAKLCDQNYIELNQKKIKLLNLDGLVQLARIAD